MGHYIRPNLDEFLVGQDLPNIEARKAKNCELEWWQTIASCGHRKMILPSMQPSLTGSQKFS